MNQEQVIGILRILLAAGTPLAFLATKYGFDPTKLLNWVIAAVPVVFGVWSFFAHKDTALAKAVSKIPGVHVVVNEDAARADLVALANDAAVKDIVLSDPAKPKSPLPSLKRR